jgi:hypothetical protein
VLITGDKAILAVSEYEGILLITHETYGNLHKTTECDGLQASLHPPSEV